MKQSKPLRKSSDKFILQNLHNLLKWYAMNNEKKSHNLLKWYVMNDEKKKWCWVAFLFEHKIFFIKFSWINYMSNKFSNNKFSMIWVI